MYAVRAMESREIQDIIIADVALTIAFSLILSGTVLGSKGATITSVCAGATGIMGLLCGNAFLFYVPIAFVAVSLSFILHEYMHKRVAQHYGAAAAFRRSDMGIIITLVSGFLGFLLGLPGATMIYADHFTDKQNGYTSLAGPLTNFAIFAVFVGLTILLPQSYSNSYIAVMLGTVMFISLWLAFVNMLPIFPLDGSKVLKWNKPVYAVTLIVIVVLLYAFIGIQFVYSAAIVLVLAVILSFISRGVLFR